MAKLPEQYAKDKAHYLLSLDWHYLRKLRIWVLQVFDSTHHGNGSLWLFTLDGRDLRLLLHASAVGTCWSDPHLNLSVEGGDAWFLGEHLCVAYPVLRSAACESVVLTGTVAVADEADNKVLSTEPYTETWKWDRHKRIFIRVQP